MRRPQRTTSQELRCGGSESPSTAGGAADPGQTGLSPKIRNHFDLGDGRLVEIDTIVTTLDEWAGRPESRSAHWVTAQVGDQLIAQRCFA